MAMRACENAARAAGPPHGPFETEHQTARCRVKRWVIPGVIDGVDAKGIHKGVTLITMSACRGCRFCATPLVAMASLGGSRRWLLIRGADSRRPVVSAAMARRLSSRGRKPFDSHVAKRAISAVHRGSCGPKLLGDRIHVVRRNGIGCKGPRPCQGWSFIEVSSRSSVWLSGLGVPHRGSTVLDAGAGAWKSRAP